MLFERKDVTSSRTREFAFFFIPPSGQKPSYPHICVFFMYVWCTSDYSLTLIYILCKSLQQKALVSIFFSHHLLHTFTQLARHHRGTTEPPSFSTLAQTSSYLRGSIWLYPFIGTSFTHSCECYCHRISFAWFFITWVNIPRSPIHPLSSSRKRGTPFLSRREHQPT